jgi:hypothetical protein
MVFPATLTASAFLAISVSKLMAFDFPAIVNVPRNGEVRSELRSGSDHY